MLVSVEISSRYERQQYIYYIFLFHTDNCFKIYENDISYAIKYGKLIMCI